MVVLGAADINRDGAGLCTPRTKVSVVQRSGQILTREDRDMADLVMERLSSEG